MTYDVAITQDQDAVVAPTTGPTDVEVLLDSEIEVVEVPEQGPPGLPGAPGADGADGNTVLYGENDPTFDDGVNGNFYINTTTHFIFGPKSSGIWPEGTSLIGPPGPAGEITEAPSDGQQYARKNAAWATVDLTGAVRYDAAQSLAAGQKTQARGNIDAANITHAHEGTDIETQMSVTSDANGLKLVGDVAAPGNSKTYGTTAAGVLGWKDDPVAAAPAGAVRYDTAQALSAGEQTQARSNIGAPATAHTHTKADITDFAHTHLIADITGLQAALDAKAATSHTHTKSQITDFAHVHPISEITGLQTALDNKAALNVERQTLTGGVIINVKNLGTLNGATITVNPADRPMQWIGNNGTGTIQPGANEGMCTLLIINQGGGAAPTFSGWTKVEGTYEAAANYTVCNVMVSPWFSWIQILPKLA